jgi:hypothetical protein
MADDIMVCRVGVPEGNEEPVMGCMVSIPGWRMRELKFEPPWTGEGAAHHGAVLGCGLRASER